jgi:hypothetical protein
LFSLVFIFQTTICVTLLCHPEALTAFYWGNAWPIQMVFLNVEALTIFG